MDRICNQGLLWITIWFFLNIGLTLLNKGMMHFWSFKFPVMMSFIHQSISTFFSYGESFLSKNKTRTYPTGISEEKFEKTVFKRIILLSFLFTMNIVTGNVSLRYCSVAFTQVTRAIIPILTMIFSVFFLGSKFTTQEVIACLVICIGVAASCFGEIGLTFKGFIYTVLGCVLSSAKSISIKKVLSGDYTLQSAELIARISPFSAIEMFALSCFNGEPDRIVSPENKYQVNWMCICGAIISGIMAYFLNLTNFLATHHTSPLTVTIVGCVKQIATIVISVFLFNKPLSGLNIIGIIVTTFGSTWYSLIGIQKKQKAQSQPKPTTQNINDIDDEHLKDETKFEQAAEIDSNDEEESIQSNEDAESLKQPV